MSDENNSDTMRKLNAGSSKWQDTVGVAIERLKKSPFAQRAVDFAKGEMDRLIGNQAMATRMDASRAQTLSTNLHQMMANLIAECKEEQKKLNTGGLLGIGRRELSAHDVDTAVAGLTAITFHFENEMIDHMRRARKMGSWVAQQFWPTSGEDTGPVPTPQGMVSAGLGGRGVVGAFALAADRQRLIVEQLRQIHEYVIRFATDIQEDIAGPHGASPTAHEKALNKAIMLAQRLDYGCSQILQLLDPNIDPKAVISGNTGKLQALPANDGRNLR
jgi:hypothetical protein